MSATNLFGGRDGGRDGGDSHSLLGDVGALLEDAGGLLARLTMADTGAGEATGGGQGRGGGQKGSCMHLAVYRVR